VAHPDNILEEAAVVLDGECTALGHSAQVRRHFARRMDLELLVAGLEGQMLWCSQSILAFLVPDRLQPLVML